MAFNLQSSSLWVAPRKMIGVNFWANQPQETQDLRGHPELQQRRGGPAGNRAPAAGR